TYNRLSIALLVSTTASCYMMGREKNMARKPTDTAHLNLRYPEALRRRLERAAKNNDRSLNTEILHRLEQSFRLEDFREIQDAINEGLLKIMHVVNDVAKHIPPAQSPGLLDLAKYLPEAQSTGRKEVLELSDDELAKRIAEAEAAEQMGQAHKQPKLPDFKLPSPHEDTSEQPATDKREDSK